MGLLIGPFLVVAFGGIVSLCAAPLLSTADEAAMEHGGVVGFYEQSRIEPRVRVSGGSGIQVPVSGGTATFSSESDADVKLVRSSQLMGLKFIGRPGKLRYSGFVAQVRGFDLKYSSSNVTNTLDASDSGFAYGVGVSGSFQPTSIASVGLAWDLEYRQTRVEFERFNTGGVASAANDRLVEDELQCAVTASKRFGDVSPYAGLKLARWITRLEDRLSNEQVRGSKDGVSGVVGVEFSPTTGDVGYIEGSFFDEESVSAGWGFRF